uniref:Uncharacterized protein n=2 Tax=Aegilops tauschii subsp. strangulata TaxID=200361 RepID=A0A453PXZ9_AEGTS
MERLHLIHSLSYISFSLNTLSPRSRRSDPIGLTARHGEQRPETTQRAATATTTPSALLPGGRRGPRLASMQIGGARGHAPGRPSEAMTSGLSLSPRTALASALPQMRPATVMAAHGTARRSTWAWIHPLGSRQSPLERTHRLPSAMHQQGGLEHLTHQRAGRDAAAPLARLPAALWHERLRHPRRLRAARPLRD